MPCFIHLHASICARYGLKAFQCMTAPPPTLSLSPTLPLTTTNHHRPPPPPPLLPTPSAKRPEWKARTQNKSWWSRLRESEHFLHTACTPHPFFFYPLDLLPRFSLRLNNEASAAATHPCGKHCALVPVNIGQISVSSSQSSHLRFPTP